MLRKLKANNHKIKSIKFKLNIIDFCVKYTQYKFPIDSNSTSIL